MAENAPSHRLPSDRRSPLFAKKADAARSTGGAFAGKSPAWLAVVNAAQQAGLTDARVLITGESGVGKDVVARLIHASSPRAAHRIVAVNCAGVTETLLESELFGHTKGSFTGAWRDTRGLVHQAHLGTLFLDEVGETSLRMQTLLLRFVETGEVQRVGGLSSPTHVDARIVAATNRNLLELVAAGRFREDLLYRLGVIHLHVPPLRERPEDVGSLIGRLLARQSRTVRLTPAARQALEGHHWPGNVRELQNVIEQAVWLTPGDTIDVEHLPETVRPQPVDRAAVEGSPAHAGRPALRGAGRGPLSRSGRTCTSGSSRATSPATTCAAWSAAASRRRAATTTRCSRCSGCRRATTSGS